MFYEPARNDHGLPFRPLKAIVVPRPIGWISTLAPDGTANLAPYSFFNLLSDEPPIVGFSSSGRKHSMANARSSGEFVCNLATLPLMEAVSLTSAPLPPHTSEFDHAGLTRAPCRLVKAPRVAESPCALECRWTETIPLKGADGQPGSNYLVLGEVVGVHIDDACIRDGRVDTAMLEALARCGYQDYAWVDEVRELSRPGS